MIITLLRKPLEGSIAENALKHGCGAINIDATRVDTSDNLNGGAYAENPTDRHDGKESWRFERGKGEYKQPSGRWPANFILTHKEGCKLRGTKKIKQGKSNSDLGGSDREVGLYKDGLKKRAKDHHQGEEEVLDWVCVEGCPVQELDRQSGRVKGWSSQNHNTFNPYQGNSFHNSSTQRQGYKEGYNDDGGASRFFKQFKRGSESDTIEYFKTMITPPVDDACVIVGKPDEIDFSAYKQELLEEGSLVPTYEPMAHGCILLGEPTDEQAKEIMGILKPGAHVVMIPEGVGYKGVISLEDTGLEVRDAIFVADGINDFHYCSKASRSEREAGVSAEEGQRGNNHPTIKPIEIMEWCARDIAPNSKVVDPFLGSGTTGVAMSRFGHDFVGIELNTEYAEICEQRIKYWMPLGTELKSEAKGNTDKSDQISIFDLL